MGGQRKVPQTATNRIPPSNSPSSPPMDNFITSLVCLFCFFFLFDFDIFFRILYNTQRPNQAIREYCTTTIKRLKGKEYIYVYICYKVGLTQPWAPLQPQRCNFDLCCLATADAETRPSPLLVHDFRSTLFSFWKVGILLLDSEFQSKSSLWFFFLSSPYQCQQFSTYCVSDMY